MMARLTWIAVVLISGVAACGLTVLTAEHGPGGYKFLQDPKPVKTTVLPAPSEIDLSNHTTIPVTDKTPVRTIPIVRPEPVTTLPPPASPPDVIVERIMIG